MISLREAINAIQTQPEVRHVVSISGGKDSAALAVYLRQNYPEIPAEYVFCDTCCELPETYEYLERLQGLLGKPIIRLNALDLLGVAHKPNRNPFDFSSRGYKPSPLGE